MTKRIFRAIFHVSMLILLSAAIMMIVVVGDYISKNQQKALRSEAIYIAQAMQTEGISYLERLPKSEERITWIAADGTVLFDSRADATQMENHAEREEVQEAMQRGTGSSSRFSTTIAETAYNYAVKLSDGTILRISTTSLNGMSLFFTILQSLAVVLVLALIFAGILASKISKSIIKPLEQVDFENPTQTEVYDELAPFIRRIAVQQKLIGKQIYEQQCRQREFHTITENMQEGLLVLDAKGEILSCNQGVLRLFEKESISAHENVFVLNRGETFRRFIETALSGKHIESTMEYKDRSYKLLANPVLEGDLDLVAGVVILIFDHTEKVGREKLRREFTANVSHELKTPLTSISGFAEIMKNGMVKTEDIPYFSERIYDEAQRLIAMVQDIIQLSRLDEVGEIPKSSMVDLAAIAERVVQRLEPIAQKNAVTIEAEIQPAEVFGLSHVLEEMLYNLCDNAIRYNKEQGSVKLSVETKEHEVLVTVADTGIGIAHQEQERIFERFYRVNRSRSKEIDGTGLGLSIVKHGAKLHHAHITIDSEVDQGTTIQLHFPKEL